MTLEELQEIAKIEKEKQEGFQHRINVCVAAGCLSCQSGLVKEALEKEVSRRGPGESVRGERRWMSGAVHRGTAYCH